ncbi:MAG: CGNR zinc finger domain-containing protein [Ktedonobacterales bacterium]
MRECPGPRCGWLFLDTSKNGARRWCSMESWRQPGEGSPSLLADTWSQDLRLSGDFSPAGLIRPIGAGGKISGLRFR